MNCDFFSTKLSGIDLFEKHIDIPGGHAWCNFCMTGSKLVAMDILCSKTGLWTCKLCNEFKIVYSKTIFACTLKIIKLGNKKILKKVSGLMNYLVQLGNPQS